eukprot:gene6377-7115_t
MVNRVYDPLGLVAPVTLEERLLVRDLSAGTEPWDDPIEPEKKAKWNALVSSLEDLNNLSPRRCYMDSSLKTVAKVELPIFFDASTAPIGAVIYLRVFYDSESRFRK